MEWKEVRLGDVVEIVNGFAFKSKAFTLEGIPVIKIKNIKAGKVILNDLDYISTSDINPKYTKIRSSDILITMTGNRMDGSPETWVGKVSLFRHQGDFYLNQRVSALRLIDDSVDNNFLSYYLSSWQSQLYFALNSNSSGGQANITPAVVQEYRLMVPELETQRSIASILSSLDRKIELNNKINADLEEMAQAIFKNWFVDFEPFKDGKFVDSELGMIPEGWKVGTLEDLITIKYGKDHKKLEDGTFPVYGSGGFMRFVNSWLYDGESVLIPRKGTLDNIMYVCEKFWTVDTMFFSVPKMDYVMKYVYNYIKRFDFSKMNEGTSVPSNTAARLNKMPILIPTHEILEMYDETLCPVYNKRKMKDKESRTLSLLRDTLLPRLMSGKLEVPE